MNKWASAQVLARSARRLTAAASTVLLLSEIVITQHASGCRKRRAERIDMDNEDAAGKVHRTIVKRLRRSRRWDGDGTETRTQRDGDKDAKQLGFSGIGVALVSPIGI